MRCSLPLRSILREAAAGGEELASPVTLEAKATVSSVGVGPELGLPAPDGWGAAGNPRLAAPRTSLSP